MDSRIAKFLYAFYGGAASVGIVAVLDEILQFVFGLFGAEVPGIRGFVMVVVFIVVAALAAAGAIDWLIRQGERLFGG